MLTRELAITEYKDRRIIPDRLTRVQHAHYATLAEQMLRVYSNGIGMTRQQLKLAVHKLFENELHCPQRRIDAFCKLLEERATFEKDRRGRAVKLRQQVFRLAAEKHPLVSSATQLFESQENEVKRQISVQLNVPWIEIERSLFADVLQFHQLISFGGYEDGAALLARYNVAQCQAVLYDAVNMTIWARDDFKMILRYAKLARLMHWIMRKDDGSYVIRLDGPTSVLNETRRYGVAFAKFLPALLSCRGWSLQAIIQRRKANWKSRFRLSPADGLTSNVSPAELFDSSVEEEFASKWGEEPREGWRLVREGEILHKDQKVFIPDFLFVHESGTRAMMEVVGFWTPEYLQAKRETLSVFSQHRILLAVDSSLDWPEDQSTQNVLRYKTKVKVKDVLGLLGSPAR